GEHDDDGPAVAAERVLAYLRVTCAETPTVLVVDDLQWADEATVLLWDRLVAITRHLPLLLVAAARPEPGGLVAADRPEPDGLVAADRPEPDGLVAADRPEPDGLV